MSCIWVIMETTAGQLGRNLWRAIYMVKYKKIKNNQIKDLTVSEPCITVNPSLKSSSEMIHIT